MIFYSWICIGRKRNISRFLCTLRRVRKDIEPLDRTWSKAHKKPMSPNLNFESRHPWQSEHSWELLGFTRTLLGFTRTMLGFTRTTRGFTRTYRNPTAEIGSCPSLRLQRKRDRRLQKRTRVSPLRGISANGLLVFAEKRFGQSRDHSQKYDQVVSVPYWCVQKWWKAHNLR